MRRPRQARPVFENYRVTKSAFWCAEPPRPGSPPRPVHHRALPGHRIALSPAIDAHGKHAEPPQPGSAPRPVPHRALPGHRIALSPTIDAHGKHAEPPQPGSPHSKKQTLLTPEDQTTSPRASARSTPHRTDLKRQLLLHSRLSRTHFSPCAKRVVRSTTTAEAPG